MQNMKSINTLNSEGKANFGTKMAPLYLMKFNVLGGCEVSATKCSKNTF